MKKKTQKYCFNSIKAIKFQLKHKLFAFFVLLLTLIFLYIKHVALPIIMDNTEAQIKSHATKSINYAVAETINQGVGYGDLISIVKDENQNVSFIEANSVRINVLSKSMSKVVISNFLTLSKLPIKVSLGAFSGIAVLAGHGPKIAYKVSPHGEANCYFTSKFESAGINQTHHKLYMVTSLKVYVVLPFKTLEVKSESDVLLCETLIVGKIPEVYLNSNSLTEMLNLVPDRFTS